MTRTVAICFVLAGMCLAQAQPQQANVEAHLSKGTQLMQDQLFEEARSEFEQAIVLNPADPGAHFKLAASLLALGRNDEARVQFEQVRKLAGESPYVTYYLGRLDLLANDYKSAIERLGSVVEKPPFPDTAFHLGVAYISSGDSANGIKWLERGVTLLPRDYRVHYRLARAYTGAGRENDAAREFALYNQFRDEHKNTETEARNCIGALHSNPATAHDVCHHMFDPNDPEKLTLLGQLFGDSGAFTEALDPLKRAVQLDPTSFEAWHNLGVTYFRMQQYREAREPLEKAVALRPEFYGSVVLLGATLYMLGDDEAALPVLERAHRLNPSDTQTTSVLERLRVERQKK